MIGKDSLYVGHLGPIPLYIHWSFLILVFTIVQRNGGFDRGEHVLIVLTVLLAGIILHELGHGMMAKLLGAMGITITLWAFGGLCSSTRDKLPRREMLILAAGPAVSFALAYGALGAFWWLRQTDPHLLGNSFGGLSMLGSFLWMMYNVNWWLGVFNSLPIFPLDGGQFVFNGALALTKGNTRVAASLAMFLAFTGTALFLSWEYTTLGTVPIYTIAMFALLLWQAYSYLHH
jgi:Zn-dependent protease